MITHGLSKHPIYRLWYQIKKRCNNPKDISFKWYGTKGIKMCLEWESSFESFYLWCLEAGWTKGLSIDRKDDCLDYQPGNCTFINRSSNSKKRHRTSPVNHKGKMNPNAKLDEHSIQQLRKDLNDNVAMKDLVKTYNVSRSHLYRIKNGLRWNSISL